MTRLYHSGWRKDSAQVKTALALAHSLISKHLTPEKLKILGLGKHRPSNGGWGVQTAQTSREDTERAWRLLATPFCRRAASPLWSEVSLHARALLWWDALPSPAPALTPS